MSGSSEKQQQGAGLTSLLGWVGVKGQRKAGYGDIATSTGLGSVSLSSVTQGLNTHFLEE